MILSVKCKNCKKFHEIDTTVNNGWRWDFCKEECNEEYYLKYRCGFVPRKYVDLPKIDLSHKFEKEFKKRIRLIEI